MNTGGAARLSLAFSERLSGWYRDVEGHQRPLALELEGRSLPGARLREFGVAGELRAAGLIERAALVGTIRFASEGARWSLQYELTSAPTSAPGLRLVAAKRDLAVAPYAAFTTLRGELLELERGALLAPFAARFDARGGVGRWLRSVSLHRG